MAFQKQTLKRITNCKKKADAAYVKMLGDTLRIAGGNVSEAAICLGVSRQTMIRHLKKHFGPNFRSAIFAKYIRPGLDAP